MNTLTTKDLVNLTLRAVDSITDLTGTDSTNVVMAQEVLLPVLTEHLVSLGYLGTRLQGTVSDVLRSIGTKGTYQFNEYREMLNSEMVTRSNEGLDGYHNGNSPIHVSLSSVGTPVKTWHTSKQVFNNYQHIGILIKISQPEVELEFNL